MNGVLAMLKEKTLIQKKESLQELLLILAEFFKYPTEDFYNALQSGDLEKEMNNYLNLISSNYKPFRIPFKFNSYQELQDIYRRCFLGPSEPFAPAIESLYKPWTTDTTFDSPIAGQTGYLYGDSAIHLKYLYERYGINIPKEYENIPDHLTLLLEFLVLLIQLDQPELVTQYINDHFDWLDSFIQKLKKNQNSQLYVFITILVEQIVFSYCYPHKK